MRAIRSLVSSGFTLIEVAIVLVVIGLLLSGGLLAVAPVLDSARLTETENKLDLIEDALVVYAVQYNCLPCPATIADLGTANAGAASEDTPGNYTTACAPAGQVCDIDDNNGIVPWQNLGLSRSDVIDGYGNYIGYYIDDGDTEVFEDDGSGSEGQFERSGTSYPTATITVNDEDGTQMTAQAAYVLVSYGDDGDEAPNQAGNLNPDRGTTDPDQNENIDNNDTFVQATSFSTNTGDYFDDIVRFKTAPLIIQQCGSGACGNP